MMIEADYQNSVADFRTPTSNALSSSSKASHVCTPLHLPNMSKDRGERQEGSPTKTKVRSRLTLSQLKGDEAAAGSIVITKKKNSGMTNSVVAKMPNKLGYSSNASIGGGTPAPNTTNN